MPICVHSRTLWVSPTNSAGNWEFLLAPQPPQVFFSQRFWGCSSLHWNPGLHGPSCCPVFPPSLSALKCGTACSKSCRLVRPSPPTAALPRILSTLAACLCPSYQSGWLFLKSLVVGLPYSSIFGISDWFLFLNLLLSFRLCKEAQCINLCLHLGRKFVFSFWLCVCTLHTCTPVLIKDWDSTCSIASSDYLWMAVSQMISIWFFVSSVFYRVFLW